MRQLYLDLSAQEVTLVILCDGLGGVRRGLVLLEAATSVGA